MKQIKQERYSKRLRVGKVTRLSRPSLDHPAHLDTSPPPPIEHNK